MTQAECEVLSFEQAWKDGSLHRKWELQKALFPAGLTWRQKKRDFETGEGLSIDDIETCFSQLDNFGVPLEYRLKQLSEMRKIVYGQQEACNQ